MDDRILLVEDDQTFRQMFAALPEADRATVDFALTTEEALALLESYRYAVVVLALSEVCHDGTLALLVRIKAAYPDCYPLVLNDNADPETVVAVLKLGVRQCLPRPTNPAMLQYIVQFGLEQRQQVAETVQLRTMVRLLQIGQTLSSCLDPAEICQLLIDTVGHEAGAKRGLGFVMDGDRLECLTSRGGEDQFAPLFAEQLAPLVLQQVTRSGRVVRLVLPETYRVQELPDVREALLVPLFVHTTLVGVVVLVNNPGQLLAPSVDDQAISFLQERGARALENALKFAATRDMLYLDELSGLFNYRYLKIALEREIKRADRYATRLAVMFLDLDNFKGVNDTYGHMVGSGVLRELGGLLKRSLREVDVVIRYGGDEYTIILVETGPEAAKRVGERIRKQIECHPFLTTDGYHITITASIGFACYPDDTTGMQELLDMADRAMYVGKASGKNCVFRVASPLAGAGRTDKEQ